MFENIHELDVAQNENESLTPKALDADKNRRQVDAAPTSCRKSSSSRLNLSTSSSRSCERAMSTLLKIVNSSLQRAWYVLEHDSKTSVSVCFSTISLI